MSELPHLSETAYEGPTSKCPNCGCEEGIYLGGGKHVEQWECWNCGEEWSKNTPGTEAEADHG